jgi:hypothetical protein
MLTLVLDCMTADDEGASADDAFGAADDDAGGITESGSFMRTNDMTRGSADLLALRCLLV